MGADITLRTSRPPSSSHRNGAPLAARLGDCTALSISDWHPRAVTQDQMAVCHDCGSDQAMVIGHDVLVMHYRVLHPAEGPEGGFGLCPGSGRQVGGTQPRRPSPGLFLRPKDAPTATSVAAPASTPVAKPPSTRGVKPQVRPKAEIPSKKVTRQKRNSPPHWTERRSSEGDVWTCPVCGSNDPSILVRRVILLHSIPRTTVTCAASGHREDWKPISRSVVRVRPSTPTEADPKAARPVAGYWRCRCLPHS